MDHPHVMEYRSGWNPDATLPARNYRRKGCFCRGHSGPEGAPTVDEIAAVLYRPPWYGPHRMHILRGAVQGPRCGPWPEGPLQKMFRDLRRPSDRRRRPPPHQHRNTGLRFWPTKSRDWGSETVRECCPIVPCRSRPPCGGSQQERGCDLAVAWRSSPYRTGKLAGSRVRIADSGLDESQPD